MEIPRFCKPSLRTDRHLTQLLAAVTAGLAVVNRRQQGDGGQPVERPHWLIGKAGRLPRPVSLSEITPSLPTPQSFNYVPRDLVLPASDLLEQPVLAAV